MGTRVHRYLASASTLQSRSQNSGEFAAGGKLSRGLCGNLHNRYGAKDANQAFELKVGATMTTLEFSQEKYSPCLFHKSTSGQRCWVHGDDFVLLSPRNCVNEFADGLGKHMLVKVRGVLGPQQRPGGDIGEMRILEDARHIRWRICYLV